MKILVTGGCGFIGSNVASAFSKQGHEVTVVDNLSRPGVVNNKTWLENYHNVKVIKTDIRDSIPEEALYKTDVIFHYAAQVGVIDSIKHPRNDFSINAMGTFNLLEQVRRLYKKPFIVFASTNKVYGEIEVNKPVSEKQPLNFCTPYGCSKGSAEQYVLDYSRIYNIPSVVLRMSCIYGNRQFGTEEQGWIAHFMRAADKNKLIFVYGDGKQVRDVLYIDDYVRLMKMLVENKDKVKGQAFNIGGGEKNTLSVNECLKKIGLLMNKPEVTYLDWRPADQKYYVSDITKIKDFIGWKPAISVDEGLGRLFTWVRSL